MLKRLIQTIVAGKDLEELERRRILIDQYKYHFNDFPDITLVLKNMEDTATIENFDHSFGGPDTLSIPDLYAKVSSLRKLCDDCGKELEEYNNSFIKKE